MIEFNITSTITKSSANVQPAIDMAFKRWGAIVLNEAKTNHRYISRTGTLRNATSADYLDNKLKLYINEAKAKYGKYVHEGQRSWAQDPFIDNAVNNNIELLDTFILEEIDKLWQITSQSQI